MSPKIEPPTLFRRWRLEQGLTLEEVGGITGLSLGYISLLERGLRRLSPRKRIEVARRLGVSVRVLFEVEPLEVEEPEAVGAATG